MLAAACSHNFCVCELLAAARSLQGYEAYSLRQTYQICASDRQTYRVVLSAAFCNLKYYTLEF